MTEALTLLHLSDTHLAGDGALHNGVVDTAAALRRVLRRAETLRRIDGVVMSGDLSDDFFTLRNGRYVLPVKSTNRGRVQGIFHDSSNTGETISPFS